MPALDTPDAKRHKPNTRSSAVGSALKKKEPPGPVYEKGIEYWDQVDASVNGVLGGYGEGPVPHIEQLSSRLLLLSLLPSLSPFPNPLTPQPAATPPHRRTVLDVGAGIGRVTRHVLLPLFDDVVLLEPVDKFIREGYRAALDGEWRDLPISKSQPNGNDVIELEGWKEQRRRFDEQSKTRGKRVRFIKRGLQGLDPKYPAEGGEDVGLVGISNSGEEGCMVDQVIYDVIWCQWCLGHMSHSDLVDFLRLARAALREGDDHYVFVKENCCDDAAGGVGQEFLDEEDSSLTRSHQKWVDCFHEAGLEVIREEVQQGMPDELFVVKT
ncbi:uncharacterized protein IL334_001357 [Kwoniella shivajii]|uniref:Alpha N-terminal protein methyltransferase 1 n=1 Tax=Kwoniella shivajii TaxID=564305 RepID=A0ABZ1CS23_9TREE|nr:hypothetical protein IL334_001357 [Kwoniella shivajii]